MTNLENLRNICQTSEGFALWCSELEDCAYCPLREDCDDNDEKSCYETALEWSNTEHKEVSTCLN